MDWILFAGWGLLMLIAAFALWAIIGFLSENEGRPAALAAGISLPIIIVLFAVLWYDVPFKEWIIIIAVVGAVFGDMALFGIKTKPEGIQIVGKQERVDERNALFHRFYRLEPGTPDYERYYAENPQLKEIDDKINQLPGLTDPKAKSWHPLVSPFQEASFEFNKNNAEDLEWSAKPIAGKLVVATPEEFSKRIKGFAKYLGADLVGCAELNQAYVYSHVGRSQGEFGAPINLDHKYAIAIAIEMDHDIIRLAPDTPATMETAFKYVETAKAAMILAKYINLLGYEARAHVEGNYRVMCVPIAHDAGLGELSRLGLLITRDYGPRVRLAVVTTNMPLAADSPVVFGVQDFCARCKKCADNCPSGSIDKGEKRDINGVMKWQTQQDSCYKYWRTVGSDCGICIKVCPYSHPSNDLHYIVRRLVERNNLGRRLALWGDNAAYGKRPKKEYPRPDWLEKN